ncbi:MAG: putative ATPase [Candidatus Krumholzibacteriia bacterium]|jgi:putative ATPase
MNSDLFENNPDDLQTGRPHAGDRSPLADRMRPADLSEVVGQTELVGPKGPLRLLLQADSLPSLLLWGPPGCGKTTLARLVASHTRARFLEYSAVSVGTKELKAVMSDAQKLRGATGQRTILFLDEIHRFNKAQQDALLPWVERGDVTLIGATTENPSFEINSALISRTRLFVLTELQPADIKILLERSLQDERGFDGAVQLTSEALDALSLICEGDARAALGQLETVVLAAQSVERGTNAEDKVTAAEVDQYLQSRAARYDKGGDEHFNIISALHKSMRNSDVHAALYWMTRMLEGGEDPLYIARRVVRFASEDIGLAEPAALTQALAARDAMHFLGMPEGALALAQAVVFMSLSPKSNSLYTGYKKASTEVARGQNPPVPKHLRGASSQLLKDLGFGEGYKYAHDQAEGIAAMSCLPDSLSGATYYDPGKRGFETELAERMKKIRAWQERKLREHSNQRADNSNRSTK